MVNHLVSTASLLLGVSILVFHITLVTLEFQRWPTLRTSAPDRANFNVLVLLAWHGPVIAPRLFQRPAGKSSSASRAVVCFGWAYILALGLCCASLVDKVSNSVIALIALCLAHTVFVGFNLLAQR